MLPYFQNWGGPVGFLGHYCRGTLVKESYVILFTARKTVHPAIGGAHTALSSWSPPSSVSGLYS
jgi:hypothetical protein